MLGTGTFIYLFNFIFFLRIGPDQGGKSGGDKSSHRTIYDQTSSRRETRSHLACV